MVLPLLLYLVHLMKVQTTLRCDDLVAYRAGRQYLQRRRWFYQAFRYGVL